MNIGMIGVGMIGGVLTRKLVGLGHQVFVANSRGPGSLGDFARETGAHPVSVREAAKAGEVVVITIPQKAVPNLPEDLMAETPEGTVIIDTGNYYPVQRDGRIAELEQGLTESEWVQKHVKRPVIKVFNSIYFVSLRDRGTPAGTPNRVALPISGDDARAKSVVMALVDSLGFDPVDNGTLKDSWRQQPGTSIYCEDLPAAEVKRRLGEMGTVQTPQHRASAHAKRDLPW
ncbi:NADPH-dependent F420 reductase [Stigmatella aurantiaca]|nr:NAD(P)-binding domain-containing protein [Stigmatella aurantiaca]ADO69387.1 NADP oxidoreductase, coenzyme f420-dependent [Stigmatella aurantiaca DW4/3-1]